MVQHIYIGHVRLLRAPACLAKGGKPYASSMAWSAANGSSASSSSSENDSEALPPTDHGAGVRDAHDYP